MTWTVLLKFMEMGGYAVYVWGSYLVLPALVVVELLLLHFRKREIIGHLGWRRDESIPRHQSLVE